MTHERDIERILDHWFADGPNEAPDRVLETVADRIERQSQQPAWRLQWRDSHVSNYLKPLLAVAAIVVVAVIGLSVFANSGLPTVGGPAASPSPSPSAGTIVCQDAQTPCAGPLAAGEHASTNFQPALTFKTPDGWENDADKAHAYNLVARSAAPFPHILVMSNLAIADQTASCEPARKAGAGNSVQDWIDFLTNHPGLVVSEPVPVEVGGSKGQSVEVRLAPTWTQLCPYLKNTSPYAFFLTDSGATPTRLRGIEAVDAVYLTFLDVGGETVVTWVQSVPDPTLMASIIAAAQPVIDSMRFTPTN